jgi:8-oxo-dGTP diphosphatase
MTTSHPHPASDQPIGSQPFVTVDVVLLTLDAGTLKTALFRRDKAPFAGQWGLPGGWVHPEDDQDALGAAVRVLRDKTGLSSPYLEQLHTFADATRDPRGWSVSIAYYALVPFASVPPVRNADVRWEAVDDVRALAFDHLDILRTAVARVRSKTLYSSLPVHLMPKLFTLTELQQVYETLLEAKLDKRSFRRRIEELDVVAEVSGSRSTGIGHRPAQQFKLKHRGKPGVKTADRNLDLRE